MRKISNGGDSSISIVGRGNPPPARRAADGSAFLGVFRTRLDAQLARRARNVARQHYRRVQHPELGELWAHKEDHGVMKEAVQSSTDAAIAQIHQDVLDVPMI